MTFRWHLGRQLLQDSLRPQTVQGDCKRPLHKQIVLDGDRHPLGMVLLYRDMNEDQRRAIKTADPLAAIYDDAERQNVLVFVPTATIPRTFKDAFSRPGTPVSAP